MPPGHVDSTYGDKRRGGWRSFVEHSTAQLRIVGHVAKDSPATVILPLLLSAIFITVGCVVTIKVPEWQVHMALLIVLGVVLGVLQFIMHVQSHRNTMLLQAMLPQRVLQRLTSTAEFIGMREKLQGLMAVGTPAELILSLMNAALTGAPISPQDAMVVRAAVLSGSDIHSPMNLEEQMQTQINDDDVVDALNHLLGRNVARGNASRRSSQRGSEGGDNTRRMSMDKSFTAKTHLAHNDAATGLMWKFRTLEGGITALMTLENIMDPPPPAYRAMNTGGDSIPGQLSRHTSQLLEVAGGGPVVAGREASSHSHASSMIREDNIPQLSFSSQLDLLSRDRAGPQLTSASSRGGGSAGMHRSSVISPRNGGIPSDSSTSLAAAAAGGGGHPHGSTSPLQPHGSIPLSSHPSTAAMLATQGSAPPGLVMTGHLHDSSHLALQGASALSARAGPKGLDIAVQAISTIAHLRSSTAAAAEAAASAHAAASAASLADIIGGGGAVIVGGTCWRELKMGAPPSAAKRNRRLSSTHGAGHMRSLMSFNHSDAAKAAADALATAQPSNQGGSGGGAHHHPQPPQAPPPHQQQNGKSPHSSIPSTQLGSRSPRAVPGDASLQVLDLDEEGGDPGGRKKQKQQQQGSLMGNPKAGPVPYEDVYVMLDEADNEWTFDAFALEEATDGHPLSTLAYFLFSNSGLMHTFNINALKLARFLRVAEDAYRDNPYHNRIHACDVLQTFHVILTRSGLMPHYVDPLTMMACYLAAIGHDIEHVGLTNDFLINTDDTLAIIYSDRSPMEMHHLSALFGLLRHPMCNFLAHLPREEMMKLRKTVIDLVLATDMKQHFALMGQFAAQHNVNSLSGGAAAAGARSGGNTRGSGPYGSHGAGAASSRHGPPSGAGGVSTAFGHGSLKVSSTQVAPAQVVQHIPKDETERILSLQIALKVADLGHLAEALPVHQRWVKCLETEFFRQGDREKAVGIPISPLFDRDKPGVTKSQVGFFDFVVTPLCHNFTSVFTGARPLMDAMLENYQFWKNGPAATS